MKIISFLIIFCILGILLYNTQNSFSDSFFSEKFPFIHPIGLGISTHDTIFISDYGDHRVRIFDSNGNYLSSFGTFGSEPGQFLGPHNIVIDKKNQIFVVDWDNPRFQKFPPLEIIQYGESLPKWFKKTMSWYFEDFISYVELIDAINFLIKEN